MNAHFNDSLTIVFTMSISFYENFNEEIRELKDENSRLRKLLAEKNFEIKNILKKLEAEKSISQITAGGDVASTKIVELSKRLREQNSEIEIEKTKVKQLQNKCFDLERQIISKDKTVPETQDDLNKSEYIKRADELKITQDKLKQSESKVYEFKNQIQLLKTQVKLTHQIISQEVGENVSIQDLLNSPASWKGRHQQIVSLQKRVSDLKKQLNDTNDASIRGVEESESTHSTVCSTESKELLKIRQIEKNKRENVEKLTNELKTLQDELSCQKQKSEALKARNQTLNTENKCLKQQAKILLDKEKHDNELIEALMKKQVLLKETLAEETKSKKVGASSQLSVDHQLITKRMQELNTLLKEKDDEIKSLQDQLKQNVNSQQNSQEEARLSVDSLSDENTTSQYQNSKESPKEKLMILETLYSEVMSEKNSLIQQVMVLEGRLNEQVTKLTETQCNLQAQSRKFLNLEKKLLKFKPDQVNSKCGIKASDSNHQQNLEEIQLKLEIQKDENNALKAGLQSTLKSREEDMKVYMAMLDNAKKMFMDSIKQITDK